MLFNIIYEIKYHFEYIQILYKYYMHIIHVRLRRSRVNTSLFFFYKMLKFNINRFNNMGNIKRGRISDPLRYASHTDFFLFFQNASPRFSYIHILHSFVGMDPSLSFSCHAFFISLRAFNHHNGSFLHHYYTRLFLQSLCSRRSPIILFITHTRFHIVLHLLSDVIAFASLHFCYLIPF